MSKAIRTVNAFPPKWIGLWRVKNSPYYFKECWKEAPFGDRWRAIKAKQRAAALAPVS